MTNDEKNSPCILPRFSYPQLPSPTPKGLSADTICIAHPRHVCSRLADLTDVPVGDLGLEKLGNGEDERKEKDGQDVFEEAASHGASVVHRLQEEVFYAHNIISTSKPTIACLSSCSLWSKVLAFHLVMNNKYSY